MSRSRRKKPCTGITTSESEKQDKRFANRKYRRAVKIRLTAEVENGVLPEMRELTNLQLVENLTQRLRRSSKEDTLRPYGLCHGDFVVPDDFDVCDTKF